LSNHDQPRAASTIDLLKRLIKDRWREHLGSYITAFSLMAVVAGATAASAWMMKSVINKIFVEQSKDAVFWVPLVIVAIFIAKGFASYFQELTMSRIGNRLVADMQKRMFDHLLRMDVAFFHRHASGDLITRISHSANAARDMLNVAALSLGRDLLTLIGLVAVMITQDPIMFAVAGTVGPAAYFGLSQLTRRVKLAAGREVRSAADVVGAMRETVQGIRIVKSFQLETASRKRMFAAIDAVERVANKIVRTQARVNPMIETLGGVAIALVVLYAGWRNLSSAESPGQFFAFITALLLASDPARRLSRVHLHMATQAQSVRLLYELLDTPVAESDEPGKPALVVSQGHIEVRNVSFAYDEIAPVLDNMTLDIPAGRTTALVGTSGGGKTTVFNLLLRFWTPRDGTITIDGQPISDVALASLRRNIALVSQDAFLFEGSVRDNIRAGQEQASDADIEQAAIYAHADAFIRKLSGGYDTPVGELGNQISGGQRQRLSIARAFLKNAPIVLLDEATSALDSETERQIQLAIDRLTTGRTTVVIAHRLSTVMNADLIHVIDGGKAVESGTHAQLLERNGIYARLYRLQFTERAPETAADPSAPQRAAS
jgi:ATP-binding cassette, subfamily B, bacterial MsbA